MAFSVSTAFFILSCHFWVAEAQHFNSVLTVSNGGSLGKWGPVQRCYKGHAIGFQLKIEPFKLKNDATALNGISLLCSDGGRITSITASWGIWSSMEYCRQGIIAFTLRVQEYNKKVDNTAANDINFLCSDGTVLLGNGHPRGTFGPWSNLCTKGVICGIQTRVEVSRYFADDTGLNDVRFFCCE